MRERVDHSQHVFHLAIQKMLLRANDLDELSVPRVTLTRLTAACCNSLRLSLMATF